MSVQCSTPTSHETSTCLPLNMEHPRCTVSPLNFPPECMADNWDVPTTCRDFESSCGRSKGLLDLPTEVLLEDVCSCLLVQDVVRLAAVCKSLEYVIEGDLDHAVHVVQNVEKKHVETREGAPPEEIEPSEEEEEKDVPSVVASSSDPTPTSDSLELELEDEETRWPLTRRDLSSLPASAFDPPPAPQCGQKGVGLQHLELGGWFSKMPRRRRETLLRSMTRIRTLTVASSFYDSCTCKSCTQIRANFAAPRQRETLQTEVRNRNPAHPPVNRGNARFPREALWEMRREMVAHDRNGDRSTRSLSPAMLSREGRARTAEAQSLEIEPEIAVVQDVEVEDDGFVAPLLPPSIRELEEQVGLDLMEGELLIGTVEAVEDDDEDDEDGGGDETTAEGRQRSGAIATFDWVRNAHSPEAREPPLAQRATEEVGNIWAGAAGEGEIGLVDAGIQVDLVRRRPLGNREEEGRDRSANAEADEYPTALATAKLHAFQQFAAAIGVMLRSRVTLESVEFRAIPRHLATVAEDSNAVPRLPLDLVALNGHFVFPRLTRLAFGLTVDCRHIVPLLDFCRYPVMRCVEILGMELLYRYLRPQFGTEPTMVFGPQHLLLPQEDEDDQNPQIEPPRQRRANAEGREVFGEGGEGGGEGQRQGLPTPLWLPAVYNGSVDEHLQLQGAGVYVSREYSYEGEFRNGRNEGYGRMVSKCGETYEGQWKQGRRHGQGIVCQADGKVLEGEWVRDVLHGRGRMESRERLRYEGEWRNGTLDGWGVLSRRGRLLAYGQFSEGRPSGWMRSRVAVAAHTQTAQDGDRSPPSTLILENGPTGWRDVWHVSNSTTPLDSASSSTRDPPPIPEWVAKLVDVLE